jgi:hypothetical protein
MNEKQFAKETARIIKENRKELVDCYKLNAKDDYGALLLQFTENEMNYFYVSKDYNEAMYASLKPFMIEKINKNPEKIYVICVGPKSLVACHFMVDDFHVRNN